MASGTPIIAFAPEETAAVQYARAYGWAKVVTENRTDRLVEALTQLITSKAEREEIAQTAKALAEQRHAATIVSQTFQQHIRATAGMKVLLKEG